jgi:hypothetical protein
MTIHNTYFRSEGPRIIRSWSSNLHGLVDGFVPSQPGKHMAHQFIIIRAALAEDNELGGQAGKRTTQYMPVQHYAGEAISGGDPDRSRQPPPSSPTRLINPPVSLLLGRHQRPQTNRSRHILRPSPQSLPLPPAVAAPISRTPEGKGGMQRRSRGGRRVR